MAIVARMDTRAASTLHCPHALLYQVLEESLLDWDLAERLFDEGLESALDNGNMSDGMADHGAASGLDHRDVLHISLLHRTGVLLQDGNVCGIRFDYSPQAAFDDRDVSGSSLDHRLTVLLKHWNMADVLLQLLGVVLVEYRYMSCHVLCTCPETSLDNGYVLHTLVDYWLERPL